MRSEPSYCQAEILYIYISAELWYFSVGNFPPQQVLQVKFIDLGSKYEVILSQSTWLQVQKMS